ncbi:MAG: hypothetical protein COV46_08155 [Deltaproteobacteria bacterium CG11_big_fil_rev_8_21_14_0_20_49_13]|nr:MAG: hypothetical protein COV46_08155 [Deltaproteobacteria bacterium CG11_big_fil_rev_8_21_14_0_20_49_13]
MVVAIASLTFSAWQYTDTKERTEKQQAKQELSLNNQKERERMAANSQIRQSALMAGRSQLALIKAKRRMMITTQNSYAIGNPVQSQSSSGSSPLGSGSGSNSGSGTGGKA